ncbi:MAG: hypothetical protein GY714_27565 [Desulfobacterales bacterium]|nr:hypothetical protein [Desulfobacterales bacterium]
MLNIIIVHETLYKSKNLAYISVYNYVHELTSYLVQSYEAPATVNLNIDINHIDLPIDTAIPCGLIITEIVTNSLKYAFPSVADDCRDNENNFEISLSMQEKEGVIILIVSDNGTGLPVEINLQEPASLGLRLIKLISEHQLHANLEIDTDSGIAYTLKFLKNIHNED